MRVVVRVVGTHVSFDKQLEIPMSESRVVQSCPNCQADVFLLAKYGIQRTSTVPRPRVVVSAYVSQTRTLC